MDRVIGNMLCGSVVLTGFFCFIYIVHAVRYDSVVKKMGWIIVFKTTHSLMIGHYGPKHVAVCVLKHYYSSYNKTN